MASKEEYLQYILEQLGGLAGVSSRRMFSGFGLYCGGQFFGMVFSDTLYFKVGDATREDYESRGMARFKPYKDKPLLSMSYYTVPADVLEDREELVSWARRAVEAGMADSARKRSGRKRAPVRAKAPRPEGRPSAKLKRKASRTRGRPSDR